jgi:aminoglycoside 3-N-acetyltransferase
MENILPEHRGEAATIDPNLPPLTVDLLAEQFAAAGLAEGQTVLVHTRMSALGWIVGGAVAVIEALQRALGPTGTLMMPTHSVHNTNPANWRHPPVPESWWPMIRANMPAYDPATTPTRAMGQVAELFRALPGVIRSAHPFGSFAARGPQAEFLTADKPDLTYMFGESSPLARLYDADGYIFLLGPTHDNNTSLHLAEVRANFPKAYLREGAAMMVGGERQWVEFEMLRWNDSDFATIGDSYEASIGYRRGRVGRAEVRFLRQRPLVDYAVKWMEQNRTESREPRD